MREALWGLGFSGFRVWGSGFLALGVTIKFPVPGLSGLGFWCFRAFGAYGLAA